MFLSLEVYFIQQLLVKFVQLPKTSREADLGDPYITVLVQAHLSRDNPPPPSKKKRVISNSLIVP